VTVKPSEFFNPWETRVATWDEALDAINKVSDLAKHRELAWRGVPDAEYSLHSSLYRRVKARNGAPPDEGNLVEFETIYLRRARQEWRFDDRSALELLAHVQHYGGPTRLLDVSLNPLVALWFAVELQHEATTGRARDDVDGRLFVFDVTKRQIELDGVWGGRELPWAVKQPKGWRTGLPRLWRPPSYNPRIPAQNSAFLIGGVPAIWSGGNAQYRKGPGDATSAGTWTADEVREAASVTLRMNQLSRALRGKATPTFTIRVEADAKADIRDRLETRFGYDAANTYPDLYGLARYGSNGIV
jgi:hypothetical protein